MEEELQQSVMASEDGNCTLLAFIRGNELIKESQILIKAPTRIITLMTGMSATAMRLART